MSLRPLSVVLFACTVMLTGGCATRPVNTSIAEVNRNADYRSGTRLLYDKDKETPMVPTFSGGGTRAAAFSFGVIEELRRTEVMTKSGQQVRVLDTVDVITGVSGGSFSAPAKAVAP